MRDREGDHGGRFTLPDGRHAHGTLTLAPDRPPRLRLHPDPTAPIGPAGRWFPEESTSERLIGYLYSNEEVIVGDVYLSEWFHEQVVASGRWAVIGLSVTEVVDGRWHKLRLRLTGFESVLGNAIAAT